MRHETSVLVTRPIDEVWAFVEDLFNLPRWGGGWLGIRKASTDPIGLGSTLQGRVTILGFETRISGVVTEWDPPHGGTLTGTGAGAKSLCLRMKLEATGEGTRVVRVTELEPRPAFKLLWWIAWLFIRRRAHISDQNFKRLLEAGPHRADGVPIHEGET